MNLAHTDDDHGLQWAACRTLGHIWNRQGMLTDANEPGFTTPKALDRGAFAYRTVCSDCGTERIKWFTRSGTLGPNIYRYPDGYQRTGDAKLTTVEWRHTWAVQLLGDEPTAPAKAAPKATPPPVKAPAKAPAKAVRKMVVKRMAS